MVTAASIQQVIVLEVGDTEEQFLTTYVPLFWSTFADKAMVAPRLQELYTKVRCIDFLMGIARDEVDFEISAALHGTTRMSLQQRSKNLQRMRDNTTAQILVEETKARANRGGVIAPLTRTEIEPPPPLVPDPNLFNDSNSPIYRGDPYYPSSNGNGSLGPM